jgi:hypothetical protein
VPESSDVRAVFLFHEKKVAIVSIGVDRDSFLERMRAGESIPIPMGSRGIRATCLRIESGAETLYVMTVDHLVDAEGKLHEVRFKPLR